MSNLIVADVMPMSCIDFPDMLAAVIYCQGCSWRCGYCYNKSLQPKKGYKPIPWDDVIEFLNKRYNMLDAVVFSGGEPLVQPEIVDAMREVKNLGFKVGLHTSGSFSARFKKVLPYCDWVGLSIKAPKHLYSKVTGDKYNGEDAYTSARILINSNIALQFSIVYDKLLLNQSDIDLIWHDLLRMGANPNTITIQECVRV